MQSNPLACRASAHLAEKLSPRVTITRTAVVSASNVKQYLPSCSGSQVNRPSFALLIVSQATRSHVKLSLATCLNLHAKHLLGMRIYCLAYCFARSSRARSRKCLFAQRLCLFLSNCLKRVRSVTCSLGETGKHDRLKICSQRVIGSSPIVSIFYSNRSRNTFLSCKAKTSNCLKVVMVRKLMIPRRNYPVGTASTKG